MELQYNHKRPDKRQARGTKSRRKCDKERDAGMVEEGPRTKGCVQTLEAGKVKETNTP